MLIPIWCATPPILGVHLSPMLQQVLDHVLVALGRSKVKGCPDKTLMQPSVSSRE